MSDRYDAPVNPPASNEGTPTHCYICGAYLGAGYLCDDCDDVIVHRQHNPTDTIDGFTFYFGAASGSTRKALRELQEPNVMLNYATKLNKPWWGIERLFVDSGGYSFILGKGEYGTSNEAYLDFIAEHEPELFALRDYPCEPEVLTEHDRTVAGHQTMTTDRHVALLDAIDARGIDAQPVAVVQGWDPTDFAEHVDELRDHGCLTDYVAIGSVCRRNQEASIREVIRSVEAAVPSGTDLHAFGVKGSVLQFPDVREALTSADSQSFDMRARWETTHTFDASMSWRDPALEYLKQRRRIRTILAGHEDAETSQQRLPAVVADGGEPGE